MVFDVTVFCTAIWIEVLYIDSNWQRLDKFVCAQNLRSNKINWLLIHWITFPAGFLSIIISFAFSLILQSMLLFDSFLHHNYRWVSNHYKWIVWKLASYERCYPAKFSGTLLTVSNVLEELKYRYLSFTLLFIVDRASRMYWKILHIPVQVWERSKSWPSICNQENFRWRCAAFFNDGTVHFVCWWKWGP